MHDSQKKDVMRTNAGETAASVKPRKNRTTIMCVKFWVAAWQATTAAQTMIEMATNMRIGSLCSSQMHGYSAANWPKSGGECLR